MKTQNWLWWGIGGLVAYAVGSALYNTAQAKSGGNTIPSPFPWSSKPSLPTATPAPATGSTTVSPPGVLPLLPDFGTSNLSWDD